MYSVGESMLSGKTLKTYKVGNTMTKIQKPTRQEYLRAQLRMAYKDVQYRWPNVDKLSLVLTYTDENSHPVSTDTKTLEPHHSAFIWFRCQDYECVNGGFELDNVVLNMIRDGRTEATGEIVCQGWQDRERIGQHRCFRELHYAIKCSYKKLKKP